MAEVKWIKFYIDMFDKRKIKKIRRLPDGDKILLFWVMLLATAGKCNAGGMIFITENVPFEEEDLADEFDFEVNTIRLALDTFVRLDMISISKEGYILVNGWEEYQSADKLAEMRAKDRERKRLKKAQASATLPELPNSTEIPRNIHGNSTDCPHIEEEEEKDKEKEFHSIIHSAESEYIQQKIEEAELDGDDAEQYKEELKEALKQKYFTGSLGKGVVFMSNEQFGDLCEKLSYDELNKYIEIVAECERNGKHFKKKTHYQAILDMAAKDRKVGK
jgi:predicted phage replisome organizer